MSSLKNLVKFFANSDSTKFIVIGASNNPSKFGYKVLNWYVRRSLPVIPVNPSATEILGLPVYKSLSKYAETASKQESFSISVITAPNVSLNLVDDFSSLKDQINAIWFQPGSYDATVIEKLKGAGLEDKLIYEGNCILVSGDKYLNDSRL